LGQQFLPGFGVDGVPVHGGREEGRGKR
jgi:hypothetical protein